MDNHLGALASNTVTSPGRRAEARHLAAKVERPAVDNRVILGCKSALRPVAARESAAGGRAFVSAGGRPVIPAGGRAFARGSGARHVFKNPDCQPGRDRLPNHQDRPSHGHQVRRRLFRGRRQRPPCRDRRREGVHRPGRLGPELSGDREDRRGLQEDRRPGGSPRLRLPFGKGRLLRGAEGRGHRLHRPRRAGHRRHGRQDRVEEAGQQGRRQHRARLPGRDRRRRRGGQDRRRDRLSGDDQGLGRRRRQGHAGGLERGPDPRRLQVGQERGPDQLRRRPGVHREVHRRAPAYRNPGAGRRPRQRRLSRRARMFDPAPPSEGDRGGPEPVPRRQDPQGDGRAGGGPGQDRAIQVGRHRRVHRRRQPQLLLPRDEHPAPGRASGDRDDHRRRSGRADDPGRVRRKAAVHPGRCEAARLVDGSADLRRRPDPQLPALHRPGHPLPAAGREPVRARRYRRLRGRRDQHVLRSDDRQAGHPGRRSRDRHRPHEGGARRLPDPGRRP